MVLVPQKLVTAVRLKDIDSCRWRWQYQTCVIYNVITGSTRVQQLLQVWDLFLLPNSCVLVQYSLLIRLLAQLVDRYNLLEIFFIFIVVHNIDLWLNLLHIITIGTTQQISFLDECWSKNALIVDKAKHVNLRVSHGCFSCSKGRRCTLQRLSLRLLVIARLIIACCAVAGKIWCIRVSDSIGRRAWGSWLLIIRVRHLLFKANGCSLIIAVRFWEWRGAWRHLVHCPINDLVNGVQVH